MINKIINKIIRKPNQKAEKKAEEERLKGRVLINISALELANKDVVSELVTLGFYNSRIEKPKIQMVDSEGVCGYQSNDGAGIISVPRVPLASLRLFYPCKVQTSNNMHEVLVDFLRYEYAHAVADEYTAIMQLERFSCVTGSKLKWAKRNRSNVQSGRISPGLTTSGDRFSDEFRMRLSEGRVYYNFKRGAGAKFIDDLAKAIKKENASGRNLS